jgi:ribose transport system ATP-binding protein
VKPVTRTAVEDTRQRVWELVGAGAGGVGPVSFSVKPREMLGLTGLRGAGQGNHRPRHIRADPTAGECLLDGKEAVVNDPAEAIAAGLRFASGDRWGEPEWNGAATSLRPIW